MQLTMYTDYSLRVLLYLGVRPDQQATITEISESYNISRNHLVKVVHNLGSLGFIKTTRGRGGGIILAFPPDEINIGDVVRKTEPNFNLVECFDNESNSCSVTPSCKLIGALKIAHSAFMDVLNQFTLDMVVLNREQLASILKINIIAPSQSQ